VYLHALCALALAQCSGTVRGRRLSSCSGTGLLVLPGITASWHRCLLVITELFRHQAAGAARYSMFILTQLLAGGH
jgi:hypothetical protein